MAGSSIDFPLGDVSRPAPGLMARWIAWLITLYQRHISPRKGFRCAHRALYRAESCSQYIRRMVLEHGTWAAIGRARERFQACRQARDILCAMPMEGEAPISPAEQDPEPSRRRRSFLENMLEIPSDCCCDLGLSRLGAMFGRAAQGGADAADNAADVVGAGAGDTVAEGLGTAGDVVAAGADVGAACTGDIPFDCCG